MPHQWLLIVASLLHPRSTTAPPVLHRNLQGETHTATKKEQRGRPTELTNRVPKIIDKARVKLIKEADNDYPVTWPDVVNQGVKELRAKGLTGRNNPMWSVDWIAKQMWARS